jgi:hypothetical protein
MPSIGLVAVDGELVSAVGVPVLVLAGSVFACLLQAPSNNIPALAKTSIPEVDNLIFYTTIRLSDIFGQIDYKCPR